jgi:hypothetical protein
MSYGPYHRLESPTQTSEDALRQERSREIWGRASRPNGMHPCVKAYPGNLPPERRGIEFTTRIPHDSNYSTPYEKRWYYPDTPGVEPRENGDFAAVRVDHITNRQPQQAVT